MVLNWIIFIVYCIFMLGLGWYGYINTKDSTDYYIAGRKLGTGVLVPLFAAGFFSGASIIGMSSYAYTNGYAFLTTYLLGLSGGWLLLSIVAPKISGIKKKLLTTPALYAERYYSPKFMKGWMGIYNVIYMYLYVVLGLTGVGAILGPLLGLSYQASVIAAGIVFLLYTGFGGMFSVAWTNVAQFAFLAFSVIVVTVTGITKIGGFTALHESLLSIDPTLLTPNMGGNLSWTWVIGTAITHTMGCPILTYYHRMFYSARSDKAAVSMIGWGAIALFICYGSVLYLGSAARVLMPGMANPETTFASLTFALPPVLAAIVAAGVIAAVQSSVDNQLLAASSIVAVDIYKDLMYPDSSEKKIMEISRNATFIIGAICIITAYFRPGAVITLYNFNAALVTSVLFAPLMLGLYWPRCTKEAGITASIFGFFGSIIWWFWGIKSIPPAIVIVPINFIIMIIISYRTPAPPEEVVKIFFSEEKKVG